MARAKFTPEQLSEFLKSSKLVDMSTPLSELMDSAAKLPMDDSETSVHILIVTDYALVTKVEEEVQ